MTIKNYKLKQLMDLGFSLLEIDELLRTLKVQNIKDEIRKKFENYPYLFKN